MIKIQINNEIKEIKEQTTCLELAISLNLTSPNQALSVIVNDTPKDLSYTIQDNDKIKFLNFDNKEGKEVFWHTSAHILALAVKKLWPEALPTIGPAIENGFYYDFANLTISEKDFPLIEKEIKSIIKQNIKLEKIEYKNKKEALEAFAFNPYKTEIIKELPEDAKITAYRIGDFLDLCRGPHLPNIGKVKAFKIMKTSGAYWRGDSDKEMLLRIYGISFPSKENLSEYLKMLEEAKKRDHKILGQNLDLYSFKEEAPGMPFLHPKGMHIWNTLLEFLRQTLDQVNYKEIKTPLMMSKDLWERSGHWQHYKDNMYLSIVDKKEYAIKPMNCPGCMLFYKSHVHSYRELPLRISEIGLVHRHELSGSLNGLFRVRCFHQDDAHVFMKKDQIKDVITETLTLVDKVYMTFGLSYKLELSTRPEKSKTIGSDEDWEITTSALKEALEAWGHSYNINEGDGAFYGPKIDIHIKDALGRFWQCATIQLDMSLPEKFQLEYVSQNDGHQRPIMMHRTILGSIERFLGVLTEHFAAKFPLWISPYPVCIIPVADRHVDYANSVAEKIKDAGFLCEVDTSRESVSKKVRNAQLLKTNYMLTVGDEEIETKTVSLRTRDNVVHGKIKVDNFLEKVVKEKKEKSLISSFNEK